MDNKENIDLILEKVKKVWKANPELRLGQLLCQVANYGALYYSTNDDIIKLLEQKYNIDTSDVTLTPPKKTSNKKMPDNKGRIYIHKDFADKDTEVKAVFSNELEYYLAEGWSLGRKAR